MKRLCGLLVFIFFLASPAWAQQVQRIVAVVNDDVISSNDLDSRTRLMIFSARLADTPQTRERVRRQVLKTLIDERLQLQEAKRRKVSVSKRDVEKALGDIEKQNKLRKGELGPFLALKGIPVETLSDQIRANMVWSKLIGRRLRPRITVSVDEAAEFIERMKSQRGQTEYRIAEIVMNVGSDAEAAQVRRTAARLADQIRAGAPFPAVARQFSQSASAAVGGDLGWLRENEIDSELNSVIRAMNRRQISDPIRTAAGYRIVTIVDKRKIGATAATAVKLDLKQVFLPVTNGAQASNGNGQMVRARAVRDRMKSCDDVAGVAKEVGSTMPPNLGRLALADLSPVIRNAVGTLQAGDVSQPIRLPTGVMLLMVCDREEPKTNLPNEEAVQTMLVRRRLSLMVRGYMRDVRLAAVIEVRI